MEGVVAGHSEGGFYPQRVLRNCTSSQPSRTARGHGGHGAEPCRGYGGQAGVGGQVGHPAWCVSEAAKGHEECGVLRRG